MILTSTVCIPAERPAAIPASASSNTLRFSKGERAPLYLTMKKFNPSVHLERKGGGRNKRGASGGPAARRWDAKSLCGLEVWHWRRLVLLDVLCTYEKFKEVVHACLL